MIGKFHRWKRRLAREADRTDILAGHRDAPTKRWPYRRDAIKKRLLVHGRGP